MKTKIFAVILCLVALMCIFTLAACDEETDCAHASKQWVEEVSASCTADGTVGHYVCPDCNEKLDADGKSITDLTVKAAHSPKNEWSVADGKHYHACENCDAKLDEEACSGGTATCTEKAKCTVCQNAYGPEPSHAPVSEWSVADGKHYHACENCDAKLDEEACSGGTATCTEKAKCTVCQNAYGSERSHAPVSEWSVADGKHYHACENCDAKLDEETCSGGTATCTEKAKCTVCQNVYGDFGDCVYDIPDYDEDYHWMECQCGEKGTLVAHSYPSFKVTPPTCTEGGYTTYSCDCGHSYKDDETAPAKHKYSEKWEYDGSHHWHEAICGCENEISAYQKHSLTANITEPTCTAQGFTVYTCDCGYQSAPTEFVPATGHSVSQWNETNSVLFDAKKCEYTVYYSGECDTCGGTDTKTEQMEKHSEYARITTPATCKTEGVKSWFCSSEDCVHHNIALYSRNYTDTTAHVWEINHENSKGNTTVYKCRDCNATKTQSNGNSADISSDDLKDMSEIELSDSKNGSDQNIVIGIDKGIKDKLDGKDVNISAGTLDDSEKQNAMNQSNLDEEQRKQLEGCTIYDFTLSTSEQISKLGGWATIRIPYTLQSGENPNSIIVWYINNGKLEAIEAVYAEDANGKGYVTFQTDHFSYYTVAQIDPADICKQLNKHDDTQLHVIAPTCTTGGYTVCLRCGEQVEGSAVPALGHTLNAEVLTDATCTEAGLVHYTCANCDLTYDAAIPAIGHYHVLTEQITATCQTVGSTTYACVHCSDSYTMTTPKLNHVYHTVVIEPTCDTNGYTEKTCTQCGNVVKAAYTAAVGHTASTEWYRSQDVHYHVCTICGEKMNEAAHTPGAAATETTAQICTVCEYTIAPPVQHIHVLSKVDGVKETCTQSGNIEYYTCACGTWFADKDAQMLIFDHASVIVDAKGHTVESTSYQEPTCEEVGYTAGVWCSVCETYLRGHVMISAYGHDYHQMVKAPTCTEQGSITYRCAHCGDTEGMQGEVIEALGHNVTAMVKAPTCTEKGYTAYSCTRCDYHTTENEKVALGHNYSSTYVFDEEGHYHSCTRCDAATEMEAHIADYPEATEAHGVNCVKCNYKIAEAIEHTHTSQKAVAAIAPTCETSGNIAYYICSCGEWFADEDCTVIIYNHSSVILQPTGHKLVYHPEQKATCTESGYTSGILCEACLVWQSGHKEIAPVGHRFLNQFEYDDEGHRQICQSCGATSETASHTHFISVTKPTCTTEGYTTYSCPCGHTYTNDKIAALDHAFGQWMPMANGQHMCICGNDPSHVDIADCTYSSEVIAPTCEKNGYTKHTCGTCGYSYQSDKTDALGHDFDEWTYDGKDGHVRVCKNDSSHSESDACVKNADVHKPTCTEGGYTQYFCEVCKHSYRDNETSALGHRYVGGRCERCGEIDEKVVYQYRKEYTTENGITLMEEYLFCPNGTVGVYFHEITDGNASLKESGISYWKSEKEFVFLYADKKATQLMACYTVDEVGMLTEYVCENHEYSIQQSYQSATCTEDGHLTLACKYCGDIFHEVYPALQHAFSKWHSDGNGGHYRYCYHDNSHTETGVCEYTEQIVPPTCEMGGYTKHICTICEGYYEDTYVPAVDHEYHWTPWYSGQHRGICVYDESHTVFEICVYKDGICLVCGQTVSDKNIIEKAKYTEVSEDGTSISTGLYTFYDNGVVAIEHSDGTVSSMYWNKNGKYFRLYENLNLDISFVGSAVITDQGELLFCVCEDGKHGDVSMVDMTHPSCTEDGYRITQCMICGERFTEVLPATGHTWSVWQPMYEDSNQPSKQHTRWCQNDMSHREIADCYYVTKVIAPTCTENGYTLYECECGSRYMTDETLAHGHSFADGRCQHCGKSEFPEVVYSFAGEITSVDGTYYEEIFCYDIYTVVLKRYTVSENGEKIFVEEKSMYWSLANKNTLLMLFLDETYNESYYSFDLSEDGTLTPYVCEKHSYKILVDQKNATCEEDGYRVYRCYFCHVTLKKADPALGHAYGEWTPMDKGMHAQICANDASHVITEACQYTHDHKDPTCTKSGYSKDVCMLCYTEVNEEHYPATGHSFTDGVCQACGAWEPVDENDVLDEEYRTTVLKEMSTVWKEIRNEYIPSETHTKEYTRIRQAMQAANSKAELQHYYGEFETLIEKIENEADNDGFREDILKQMNSTWDRWMTEGRSVTEKQQTEFFQMYDAVKQAADKAEIQSWYEKFREFVLRVENGDEGGDVTVDEKLRAEILSMMNMKWADIMAQNATTAEQQMRYDQLCADVSEATSNDEIQNLYAQFQDLVWEIENNQSPDVPVDEKYRQEVYTQINDRYSALVQGISSMNSAFRKQLMELRTAVKTASTYTELNSYVSEFDALEKQILTECDELSSYRYSVLLDMFTCWTELKNRGLVTSEYDMEFKNSITSPMRNAVTIEEINYFRDLFDNLVYCMEHGGMEPTVDEVFRYEVLTEMDASFERINASGWKVSEEDYQYLHDLHASVKDAKTNDDIQMFLDKFNNRMNQIESENQGGDVTVDEKLRAEILSMMNMKWADIMAQNAATAEQQMRYDQLCADVSEATSNDKIKNLYAQFQDLVWEIENGGSDDPMIDEAYRKELLNSMRQHWTEVLQKYIVSEDSALYAEQLMSKVENAIMMEELNWANDEFWRLVNDIENGNSEKPTVDEVYRKNILEEMWRRWDNYTEKYGSTEVDQKNFDHWIDCVKGATSNEQIDKYHFDFDNWMSKLEKDSEENQDHIEDIWVDQHRFGATEGMDVQQFIMDHIVGMNMYIQYSQSGVTTIPVTYEMIVWEQDVSVFETVGNYFFWIEYEENGHQCSVSITVIVQPDMSNANLLGEYTIAGALVGSSEDWILKLYDNGLAVMAMPGLPETQQFFSYTLDGTILSLDSNGIIMVMQLNEETHAAEMYYPTEPLIGTYYYYDVMFQVYGAYAGAGDYITVMTQVGPNGTPIHSTIYMTLDLENRTLTAKLFGDRLLTFDDDGNLSCKHEYTVQIQEPTCMESGYRREYCIYCGECTYEEIVSPLGHVINASGVCENCGMSVGIVVPEKDYTDRYLCRMDNVWYPLVENYGWEFFENYRIDTERFEEFRTSIMKAETKEEAQYFYTLFLEWIDQIHRESPDDDLWATRRELLEQIEREWMILNDEYGEFINDAHIVWYEDIQDMMYATNDRDVLISLYKNDFCMLMQEIRDFASNREDCVQEFYLEQNRFELTEGHGHDVQTFIEKYVLGTRVYVLYEQAGLMEFPITWDMISYEMTDIDRVGEYYFEIHFSIDGFDAGLEIRLVVRVDMSKANALGSYACDMSCIGENVMLHMEIYDNGYAIVTVEGAEGEDIFPCRIENDMIYLELGTGVFVMQIDGENTAHMYVPAEDTPIVGTYQYSFLLFNVYGPYTGAGEYVAMITMLNGNPSWMTQVIYLDLENAVFECVMLGGQLTFDENGILTCRHEFEWHTQEPTCTESGFVEESCIHCGISNFAEIPPLGHSYVNGICENCGCMEQNDLQPIIETMLNEMEWQWNSLWNDYGEMNPAILVAHQNEYAARYDAVKQSTSAEEAQRHFDAFVNMIEKIRNQLGEPTDGELERTRQEFLGDMESEWNWLMREVGGKLVGMYWGRYDELVTRMNDASDTDMMNHIFHNEFRSLMDEVRKAAENQDSFVNAYLEQRKFELTEGHGYDLERFIAENIIGKHLYIEYSQSGVVAIPITWEMIDWSMEMDISSAGSYAIGVNYSEQNFGTWQSIQIVVWMDMSDAMFLGTYSCDLSCMGEEDVMTMEIYDNGYAFVYFNGDAEDRDLLPCTMENGVIYLDTGDGIYVMRIDGKDTAHMYQASEKDPIIDIYTYEDEIAITVYGTYDGIGQYIAKVEMMEDGEVFWLSVLVELNLENRTILCEMFSGRPISFDENGCLLDEESDDEKEDDWENSGDVEEELPMKPMDPAPTPDDSDGYGEIIIVPSEGGMNGDYTYTDTIINGNVSYIPTVGEYVYGTKTIA